MLPLKKIFPVIIALITISLLGIIYLQYNWIKNAAMVKREEKELRMVEAVTSVGTEMLNRQEQMNRFRMEPLKQGSDAPRFFVPDMKMFVPMSMRFEREELGKMLRNAMKDRKLDTTFEFGVLSNAGPQLASPGFADRLLATGEDSAAYQIFTFPFFEDINAPVREALTVFVPRSSLDVFQSLGWMIFGSILFTIIIVTAFALTIRTMLGQKKLSEIKSDFINNMTHELKTPLATISLAIDAIGNEKVMENKEKIRYFSGIIKEENKRMNKQVESILQSALMEKEELSLNLQPIDVHELIHKTVENLRLQLDGKNGKVILQLHAHQPIIRADEVHFSNLIFNLLDNAIKYSKDNLEIRINTSNTRKYMVIAISDNGIGMSRDTVSRIFEKFYRAHTGNVHNVKGFGLGLSYVKAVVDAHKGKIRVESVLGKGSRFTLEFPQD
ncbi:sensor histidine kinase [Chitinophaga lutea]